MYVELVDKKITQDQADKLQSPMELDLLALFKILEQDILETVDGYEGTPEKFIDEVCSLLSEHK